MCGERLAVVHTLAVAATPDVPVVRALLAEVLPGQVVRRTRGAEAHGRLQVAGAESCGSIEDHAFRVELLPAKRGVVGSEIYEKSECLRHCLGRGAGLLWFTRKITFLWKYCLSSMIFKCTFTCPKAQIALGIDLHASLWLFKDRLLVDAEVVVGGAQENGSLLYDGRFIGPFLGLLLRDT